MFLTQIAYYQSMTNDKQLFFINSQSGRCVQKGII